MLAVTIIFRVGPRMVGGWLSGFEVLGLHGVGGGCYNHHNVLRGSLQSMKKKRNWPDSTFFSKTVTETYTEARVQSCSAWPNPILLGFNSCLRILLIS